MRVIGSRTTAIVSAGAPASCSQAIVAARA
jgi:hypothetical protein